MKALPSISFHDFCIDPHLLGDWFGDASWEAWRVIDKALFGEPLNAAEMGIFAEITGRETAPAEQATELWAVIGRRGGKDNKATAIAAYLATVGAERFGFLARLKRGERGVVQLLAVDKNQAGVAMGYTAAYFEKPLLKPLVKKITADTIELKNGLAIEITTNDQRRARGRTVICALFDECAHWMGEDSRNPDESIYKAIKPGTATMSPGAMIIGISSPHMKAGLLFRKYRENWAKSGKVLVVKAPTWRMNPTVGRDSDIVTEAYADDPEWASAEYGAEFRTDLAPFLSEDALDACIEAGVYERPPNLNYRFYAFADPSGGTSDSFTFAIAHVEGQTVVLDCIREAVPPFNVEAVVVEYAALARDYRISYVTGDNYAPAWVQQSFNKAGVTYIPTGVLHGIVEQWQVKPPRWKSEIYIDFLPIVNSRAVLLLDHPKMKKQFLSLERRTQRGQRDSVDHPRNGHDDVSNAVAGACAMAGQHTKAFFEQVEKKQTLKPGIYGRPDGGQFAILPPPDMDDWRTRGRMKV